MAADNASEIIIISESFPTKYKAYGYFVVKDVPRLTTDKAKIYSPIFTSADDPLRTSFKMQLGFGSAVDGQLEVRVVPTNSKVRLFQYSIRIFNDQMQSRKVSNGVFHPGPKEVGRHWGWNNMLSLENEEVLRVMFDLTYSVDVSECAAVVAQTTADSQENNNNNNDALPSNLAELSGDFLALLDKPDCADVTICFEGNQKIQCHKVVLVARSSYFRGLLQSGMIESRSNQITMTDISRDLFRRVLQFLYSGQVPDDMAAIAFDLLPFSEKYVLDEFKSACEDAIISAVSADNVIQAIVLADKHHCPNLFAHCLPVIKSNIDDLQKKEEWESLIEPELLQRVFVESCKRGAGDADAGKDSGKVWGECAPLGHAMQLSTDFGRMFGDTEVT